VVGFSRQAVVSLLVGLLVVAPFLSGPGRYLRVLRLIGLACVLAVGAAAVVSATSQGRQFWSAFAGRAMQLVDPEAYRGGTAGGRLAIWTGMLDDVARNPLVGQGQDSYLRHMDPGEEGAHNFPLEVLHATGIFGFLGYLVLHAVAPLLAVGAFVRGGLAEADTVPIAGVIGFYAAMVSATVTNIIYWNPTYWLAVALMVAAVRVHVSRPQVPETSAEPTASSAG
jgi:O-antigen ligase